MALPSKTKAVEQFYIGEPPEKKRRVIEFASKLAKNIAQKMHYNKPVAKQSAPSNNVKQLHLKDRTTKQVLAKKNISHPR